MELSQIKIYRITHIQNMPHILQYGITHRNSQNANPHFITIGDKSLIDTRGNKTVYADNGEFLNLNAAAIVLGDFILFYFGVKMPMLYVVQNGGNFVNRATPAEDIVYMVCSVDSVIQSNNSCFFSDGHATDNYTTFYDRSKINELPALIDWNAVKASFWGGQENLNIKRKKQAEFLVLGDLPSDYIMGFGCYNETAKQELITMGIEEKKIKIIPNAYY